MKVYSPKRQARKSIRLKYYDYRSQGYYFITICCKDKQCFFGEVVGREMKLNRVGEVVHKEWLNTEKIRKNIQLHEFVVMPNHFHAILEITESLENNNVGANSNLPDNIQRKLNGTSNTIGAIVRGFKISVIKQIKLLFEKGELQFAPTDIWQRNYYEHIIRNEIAYFQITEYIQNNPLKWEEDCFYIL